MPSGAPDSTGDRGRAVRWLVLRNTAISALAQVIGMPLSLALTAVTARYLGASALGYMYLASTFNTFAFLAVDWGQAAAIPALVAGDRSSVGTFLGTALVWRSLTSVIASVALATGCFFLGYDSQALVAIGLGSIQYSCSAISNACQYAIMGFERTDMAAKRQVLEQAASLMIVLPILFLKGNLNAELIGHTVTGALVLVYVWRTLGSVGIGRLSFDRTVLVAMLKRGTPFVLLGTAMVLQPYVDALYLSKLAPVNTVGWHAAARKLVGLLIFPSAAMIGALYPTLCRLHVTDSNGLKLATTDVLRATTLMVVPVAVGCALFPDIGIAVYSRKGFAPAEANLRVLSIFLLLVYFTMPLGTCVNAIGKARSWAAVQALCVGVSLVFDPILIPWFQRRSGNGGLGVCWAAVLSELVVLVFGVILVPRGVFDRRFWHSVVFSGLSGLVMVAVARSLSTLSSFLVAPLSLVAYVVALRLTGAIDADQVAAIRGFIANKLSRSAAAR